MKIQLHTLAILFVLSCSPAQKDSTSADVSQLKLDSMAKNVSTLPELPIDSTVLSPPDFPIYTIELVTEKSIEDTLVNELSKLLIERSKKGYVTIKSSFSVTYPVENDYDDETTNQTTEEKETWYFNELRELSAYTKISSTGETGSTTIYVFEKEKLVGMYSDAESSGQDYVETKVRMANSLCPQCGIRLVGYGTGSYEITQLDELTLSYHSNEFFKEYADLLKILKNASHAQKAENGYTLQVESYFDETPVTMNYFVDINLFAKILKKN